MAEEIFFSPTPTTAKVLLLVRVVITTIYDLIMRNHYVNCLYNSLIWARVYQPLNLSFPNLPPIFTSPIAFKH